MPLPRTFIDFGIKSFGGFASSIASDVPAGFAEAKDAQLKKSCRTPASRPPRRCRISAKWLEAQKPGKRRVRARAGAIRGDAAHDGERHNAGRQARRDRPRRPRAQSRGARQTPARSMHRRASIDACIDKMNADKPTGGAVEGARAQLARAAAVHRRSRPRRRFPAPKRRRSRRRRRTSAGTSPTSTFPVRTRRACRRSTTSRRPIRRGRRPSSRPTSRARRTCCSPRCTKSGPATSCSSCTPTASRRSFGRLFVGYAFAEGWAHYAEEMMCETGLGDGDARRRTSASCMNALLRNVRFICRDRPAHRSGMTVERVASRCSASKAFQDAGQRAAAGGARHLRSGVSELHAGQADDPQAARRLDRDARRRAARGSSSTTSSCRTAARRFRWCARRC